MVPWIDTAKAEMPLPRLRMEAFPSYPWCVWTATLCIIPASDLPTSHKEHLRQVWRQHLQHVFFPRLEPLVACCKPPGLLPWSDNHRHSGIEQTQSLDCFTWQSLDCFTHNYHNLHSKRILRPRPIDCLHFHNNSCTLHTRSFLTGCTLIVQPFHICTGRPPWKVLSPKCWAL